MMKTWLIGGKNLKCSHNWKWEENTVLEAQCLCVSFYYNYDILIRIYLKEDFFLASLSF